MVDLLPCPFCGVQPTPTARAEGKVWCPDCSIGKTPEEWNHRVPVVDDLRVHNDIPVSMKKLPVGTPVTVTHDDGRVEKTTTRSTPWIMCGTWSVLLDGIVGCYALSRVKLRDV